MPPDAILGFLTISCQIEIDNSLHAYNLGLPSTVCRNGSYGIFKKKTTTKSGQKDNGAEELRRLLVVSSDSAQQCNRTSSKSSMTSKAKKKTIGLHCKLHNLGQITGLR